MIIIVFSVGEAVAVTQNTQFAGTVQNSEFKIYYRIPNAASTVTAVSDKEVKGINNPNSNNPDDKMYYLLGGMRLKYSYTPAHSEAPSISGYSWDMGTKGRFLNDFNITLPPIGASTDAKSGADINEVYWEPEDWKSQSPNDLDTDAKLTISYNNGDPDKVINFRIKNRVLDPAAIQAPNVLEGSDVEMLESLLWHLGLSPQKGFPGYQGTRVSNKTRFTDPTNASGFINSSDCNSAAPATRLADCRNSSIGKMVRRFIARHIYTGTGNQSDQSGSNVTSISVGDTVLQNLKVQYEHYYSAVGDYDTTDKICVKRSTRRNFSCNEHADLDSWVDAAVGLWTSSQLYTATRHSGLLDTGETVTRNDLLKAWIKAEAGKSFWGKGDPVTPFRINVGGADEYGSIGFNQILFQYVYGANQNCPDVIGKNMYHPEKNAKGMALWMSGSNPDCGRSMVRAFTTGTASYKMKYTSALPKIRGYSRSPNRYHQVAERRVNNVPVPGVYELSDDEYELLSKAIMGYNSGQGAPARRSWLGFLLAIDPTTANKATNSGNNNEPGHALEYAIKVKKNAGMRLRTYTLEWEVTPLQAQNSNFYNAGDSFCFNYGELDWYNSELLPPGSSTRNPFRSWETVRDEILNNGNSVNCTTGR